VLLKNRKASTFWSRRLLLAFGLAICTGLIIIFTNIQFSSADLGNEPGLPPFKAHPLPPTLAQWQDVTSSGDYFSEVKPTNFGYLVWSEFPVKVYVERSPDPTDTSPSGRRFQQWVDAVLPAVQEWGVYLPLLVVEQRENADIIILRSRPPLRPSFNRDTGTLQLPRARTAETLYNFYVRKVADAPDILLHRCTILVSPDPASASIKSAARHELGHALGIWGHSPIEKDVMYFSQVRNPPRISSRDINTLKRVYQRPTRLGWSLPKITEQPKRQEVTNY